MIPVDRVGQRDHSVELNGHNGKPKTLHQLTQERKRLEEEFRISQIQARQRASDQQARLLESWWDYWDSDGWFTSSSDLLSRVRGRDEFDRQRMPPSRPTDRRRGDEWPIYKTQTELNELRAAS